MHTNPFKDRSFAFPDYDDASMCSAIASYFDRLVCSMRVWGDSSMCMFKGK
jgi:hypothetical protein